jgi:HEAT repeat protein
MTMAFGLVAEARADGVAISPSALSSSARNTLQREVTKARSADASAFSTLAQVRGDLPDLDANKRGRLASITPMLRAMGKRALLPMLEELALNAQPRGALTSTAWRAWRIALLEAVGSLRDKRSGPVLVAVLESSENDFLVLRAAAQALGQLSTDGAAQKLIDMSGNFSGVRRRAALAGLGHCRREVSAEHLAQVLSATTSHRDAEILARALGDVGSAWAWETPAVKKNGAEENGTRSRAAESLIEGFLAFDDAELRELFTKAILVVDWQGTKALIAAARKGQSSSARAALDELERRFDDSPLH